MAKKQNRTKPIKNCMIAHAKHLLQFTNSLSLLAILNNYITKRVSLLRSTSYIPTVYTLLIWYRIVVWGTNTIGYLATQGEG